MADVQEPPRNALWRREEQLRRWHQSETNKESPDFRNIEKAKIHFQDGCVFLAACSSCDKDEVQRLLARGADINTANIDGLTALHQACIDDNLEMVEFLLGLGADIDACDNEGWTPLHATASCGFLDIAKYLINQGANVAAVNNDGELAIDIVEGDDMEQLLFEDMEEKGVDADVARNEEEELMLRDANQWLACNSIEEVPHPVTGATALHVAAAKGYIKVMNVLIHMGVDLDAKDLDGWTALHAAAHWGQEEACKILVENLCNMDIKNLGGQTAFDIADPDLVPYLEELKRKQATLKKDREDDMKDTIQSRGAPPLKRRSSVTRMSVDQKQNVIIKNVEDERAQMEAMKNKCLDEKDEDKKNEEETSSESATETSSDSETEKQNKINTQTTLTSSKTEENGAPSEKPISQLEKDKESLKIEETKSPPPDKAPSQTPRIQDIALSEELQREADKENERQIDKQVEKENDKEKANLKKDEKIESKEKSDETEDPSNRRPVSTGGIGDQQESRNRSFEPPKRDEERETERKAKAKRARETRRSTQGVTKEDLEMAEKTLAAASRGLEPPRTQMDKLNDDKSDKENKPEDAASIRKRHGLDDKNEDDMKNNIRKPRDSGLSSDTSSSSYLRSIRSTTTASTTTTTTPSITSSLTDTSTTLSPAYRSPYRSKYTRNDEEIEKKLERNEDKKEEKEDPSQKSSAIRTRRKRENRRPTGKITLEDIQGISPEDSEKEKSQQEEDRTSSRYGSSRYSDPSGTGSSSLYDRTPSSYSSRDRPSSYSGYSRSYTPTSLPDKDLEYKKLYEDEKVENERLKKEVKKFQHELSESKSDLEKARLKNETSRAYDSTSDKRERRALERKLSEMEEELKAMENLKADNQRLKEENGALIRVISKLSK